MAIQEAGLKALEVFKTLKWWQVLLLYPLVAVALAGLVPGSTELWRIIQTGGEVPIFETKYAVQQMKLWQKNARCVEKVTPQEVTATDAIIVSVKMCPSGDVLVSGRVPGGLPVYRWVPLHSVMQPSGPPTASISFFPSAIASELGFTNEAMPGGEVMCQRWVGNGLLLQRIYWQPTNSCFDNVINTYTGVMVSSRPAPCNPHC